MSKKSLIIVIAFCRWFLFEEKYQRSIINDCNAYLCILMYGIAGMAYYNILSGILRGIGDSFSALLYLLIATVLNIVLDIWFVAGFEMGVTGVALATVIAQAVYSL